MSPRHLSNYPIRPIYFKKTYLKARHTSHVHLQKYIYICIYRIVGDNEKWGA